MASKDHAKQVVAALVQRFLSHERKIYSEARTKAEFIDPFFTALGWSVTENTFDFMKKSDYAFGTLMIVEVKTLHTVLTESSAIQQLRTYAYTTLCPVGVMTNFAEIAVYDCLSADNQCVLRLHAEEYLDNFDELWRLLSRTS